MHGLESVLEDELSALGAKEITPLKRAVSFVGDRAMMYRANYELRTALRVLMPIHGFLAHDEKQFYARVRDEIDWAKYIQPTDTIAVDSVVLSRTFTHSQYMALTVKDAVCDQFRERFGQRPSVDVVNPTLRISVRIHENHCDILLDSSGDSLHKRGYRKESVEAPINEVLGAGMIKLAGWTGMADFVDPMCGSGTLPIEAALMAMNIAPQKNREKFGFMRWNDFDAPLWEQIKAEAAAKETPLNCKILAYDKEGRSCRASNENIEKAGLGAYIKAERKSFEELDPLEDSKGILMFNPPYDARLHLAQVEEFYGMIGSRLKHHWAGWKAWVISSNKEAMHHIGLRPSRKFQLFNGPLECFYYKYELFEGKKGYQNKG